MTFTTCLRKLATRTKKSKLKKMATHANLTSIGVRLTEKENEFKALMASYPRGTAMAPEVKKYAESMTKDIGFLKASYATVEEEIRTQSSIKTNIANSAMLPLGEQQMLARQKVLSPSKIFGGTFEAKRDAMHAGEFIMALIHPAARTRAQYADKVKEYFGVSMEDLQLGITAPGEQRALGESVNQAGAYLTPALLESYIVAYRQSYGVARRFCKIIPMGSDKVIFPKRVLGSNTYYINENSAFTESDPTYGNYELNARQLAGLVAYSNQLGEDSLINIADYIFAELIYNMSYQEDIALISGDGTSTYGGIKGLASGFAADTTGVVTATSGTSTDWTKFVIGDFTNLIGKTTPLPGANEAFFCSKQFFGAAMLRLAATAGGNRLDNLADDNLAIQGYNARFMGFPVVFTQAMPTAAGTAQNVCYFGTMDLAVSLGQRAEIALASSTEAQNAFVQNQTLVRGIERFDINPHTLSIYAGDNSTLIPGPLCALKSAA